MTLWGGISKQYTRQFHPNSEKLKRRLWCKPCATWWSKGPDSKELNTISLQEAVLLAQKELFGDLTVDKGLDSALIHPAYVTTGMVAFWETFDHKNIQPLQQILPSQSKGVLDYQFIIAQAATATFLDISLHAKTANTAILHLMTKGAACVSFKIPSISTLKLYVVTKILLLRWLIYVLENPIRNKKKEPLFKFHNTQSKAIQALINAAKKGKSNEVVAAKVVEVLHSLYFPSNPDRAVFNNQIEPVNTFLALLCLTDKGAPRPISDVPHYCGRLQFSMRLCAYHYLYQSYTKIYVQPTSHASSFHTSLSNASLEQPRHSTRQATTGKALMSTTHTMAKKSREYDSDYSSDASDVNSEASTLVINTMELPIVQQKADGKNWWQNVTIPWCSQYLTENEPTPYGHVRTVMRKFRTAVKKHCNQSQVRWIEPNQFLLEGHEVCIDQFRSHLHFQLDALEKFFLERLLFGETLDSLGITVNFTTLGDTGDKATIWHSPLLDNIKGNTDSEIFLAKLVAGRALLRCEGKELEWTTEIAEEWLKNIHIATCRTQAITHITEGPQMYQNITNFFASPNHDGTNLFPDFPIGARRYRQLVVTVQRKHLCGPVHYSEIPKEESVGDKQAGRSTQTSNQYYAIEKTIIDREAPFVDHYINYSKSWHKFWQIPTEHSHVAANTNTGSVWNTFRAGGPLEVLQLGSKRLLELAKVKRERGCLVFEEAMLRLWMMDEDEL
ncbi:hypothetical protein BJ912DRAFT_937058 [Pholiota molesta]|nr:hypothetical protein BJ912DRAFT_937058 [Pholiota molesta]